MLLLLGRGGDAAGVVGRVVDIAAGVVVVGLCFLGSVVRALGGSTGKVPTLVSTLYRLQAAKKKRGTIQ